MIINNSPSSPPQNLLHLVSAKPIQLSQSFSQNKIRNENFDVIWVEKWIGARMKEDGLFCFLFGG